jgi:hypothetical protein
MVELTVAVSMSEKGHRQTKLIAFAAVLLVVVASVLVLIAFFAYQKSAQPSVDYWILNVSIHENMGGYVTPNGTIQVPLNQTGITVTATPTGWNGFMYWILDGAQVPNDNHSSTIFVPRQRANSTHTIEAQFVIGTPPIFPVFSGNYSTNVTIDAGEYKAYNFSVPSGSPYGAVSGYFGTSGDNQTIRVYIMNSANFVRWQDGLTLHSSPPTLMFYGSGEATNDTITAQFPVGGGTFFIVFDNTFDTAAAKSVNANASFYYIPK